MPPSKSSRKGSRTITKGGSNGGLDDNQLGSLGAFGDLESQTCSMDGQVRSHVASGDIPTGDSQASQSSEISFFAANFEAVSGAWWRKFFPSIFGLANENARIKSSILAEANSTSMSRMSLKAMFCPYFDQKSRQREAFLEEMR